MHLALRMARLYRWFVTRMAVSLRFLRSQLITRIVKQKDLWRILVMPWALIPRLLRFCLVQISMAILCLLFRIQMVSAYRLRVLLLVLKTSILRSIIRMSKVPRSCPRKPKENRWVLSRTSLRILPLPVPAMTN